MNILITGGTGLLGYNLLLNAPSQHNIITCYLPDEDPLPQNLPAPSVPMDITNLLALKAFFSQHSPSVVIHTAAQGSVDWCEENKPAAFAINVASTKNLIRLSRQNRAHFIYISSNAIYDGNHSLNDETRVPRPLNYYGAMKVAVEKYLGQQNISHTILRPNLMYGWPYPGGRDNQATRVISALTANQPTKVVNDTYFSPLSVTFMSQVIWHVALNKIAGTYNVGGAERSTLYKLAQQTAQVFSLNSSLIQPMSHRDTNAAAPRAIDTSFSNSLLQRQLKITPWPTLKGLEYMKEHAPVAIPA